MQIVVCGLASGRSKVIEISNTDTSLTLLDFLRKQDIPIASSCGGEGVCQKCVIQNNWLSCTLSVKDFLAIQPDGKIMVSYL